ncbi:MAG: hypothetical protein ABIL67_04985 [candidate division WOR-3 bacterium]
MRFFRVLLFAGILMGVILSCRKSVPTAYMRALSAYVNDPYYGDYSYHYFQINAVSPNYKPQISFNGRNIPDENTLYFFGEYSGFDTLPKVSPNAEVEMSGTYKDLNEGEKKISSKIKLPNELSGLAVKITGGELNISWGKPDEKQVSAILVEAYGYCTDGSVYVNFSWDTVITDVANKTSVSKTLTSLCRGISTIVYAEFFAGAGNISGPWKGGKDNIKGIKGQYYGLSMKYDTTSWVPVSATNVKFERKIDRLEVMKKTVEALNKYLGVEEEGSWINGF